MGIRRIIQYVFWLILFSSVNGQSALLNRGESGFGIAYGGISIEDFSSNGTTVGLSINGVDLSIAKINTEGVSSYSQSISYLFPKYDNDITDFMISVSHSKQEIKTEVRNYELNIFGITANSFGQFRLNTNTNLFIGTSFGGAFSSDSGILSIGIFATLSSRGSNGPVIALTPEIGMFFAKKRITYLGLEFALVVGVGD